MFFLNDFFKKHKIEKRTNVYLGPFLHTTEVMMLEVSGSSRALARSHLDSSHTNQPELKQSFICAALWYINSKMIEKCNMGFEFKRFILETDSKKKSTGQKIYY